MKVNGKMINTMEEVYYITQNFKAVLISIQRSLWILINLRITNGKGLKANLTKVNGMGLGS